MFAREVNPIQILQCKGNKNNNHNNKPNNKLINGNLLKIFRQLSVNLNKPIPRPMMEEKAKLIELEKAETGHVCLGF